MENKLKNLFCTALGRKVYSDAERAIGDYSMDKFLSSGVLVGFSGGADSVLLLCFLLEYRRRNYHFPILVCHINHMIRGAEADRDEAFSRAFCESLGVEFISARIDAPSIAKDCKIGIEEAARNARYSCFRDIIESRNDISSISVAHNATDNLETVIFHMMRGSGLRGICGIPPVRDNIFRPLIYVPKTEIIALAREASLEFVNDSTNDFTDYSRNYIRHEILPKLTRLSPSPENSVSRMTLTLGEDLDYLDSVAAEFVRNTKEKPLSRELLLGLHPAIFSRVFILLAKEFSGVSPEQKHVAQAHKLLKGDNFSLSLPGEISFKCERGVCLFLKNEKTSDHSLFCVKLHSGKNVIDGYGIAVHVDDIFYNSSSNVYKFSIQETVSSAIIKDGLYLRFKKDGDAYRYGGMNRKLKKVFNDKNIPPTKRELIPVLCDSKGILWVPGLPVRDGAKCDGDNVTVTVGFFDLTDGLTEVYPATPQI